MLVARFGPTTAWHGKEITHEGGQFVLGGHGVIRASDVMRYDAEGHLVWDSEGARGWVGALAAKEPPPQPVQAEFSATYLGGGPPHFRQGSRGRLLFTPVSIGFNQPRQEESCTVAMSDVAEVSVDGAQIAVSRAPAVLAFGIFGLAAKSTMDHVYLIVRTKSGLLPTYELKEKAAVPVRAAIAPVLQAAGVALA